MALPVPETTLQYPTFTLMLLADPPVQWAAVMTNLLLMMVPPQLTKLGLFFLTRAICQGSKDIE